MNFDTTFNYLVLGLERSLRSDWEAELFQWACHQLALAMPHTYPHIQVGLLSLFEQPVKDWYPYAETHELASRMFGCENDIAEAIVDGMTDRSVRGGYELDRLIFNFA